MAEETVLLVVGDFPLVAVEDTVVKAEDQDIPLVVVEGTLVVDQTGEAVEEDMVEVVAAADTRVAAADTDLLLEGTEDILLVVEDILEGLQEDMMIQGGNLYSIVPLDLCSVRVCR